MLFSVRHQWVKFGPKIELESSDYQSGVWVLAEIDDEWPDGQISLFGVEYTVSLSAVVEWGPEVSAPESE